MAAKPPDEPRWADAGGDIVEPSAGKKNIGWADEEKPPAQFSNWLLNKIYLWILYLRDGIFKGDGIDATTKPMVQYVNQDDNTRMFIDPHGLPGGRYLSETYRWGPTQTNIAPAQSNVVVLQAKIHATTALNTDILIVTPTPTDPVPRLVMRMLDASVNQGAVVHTAGFSTGDLLFGRIDDTVFVMEWDAKMTDASFAGAGSGFDILMGLSQAPDSVVLNPEEVTNHCYFRKRSSDNLWLGSVRNGAAAFPSTTISIVPVADIYKTFPLEYHGLNTPVGVDNGFATARVFIGGVLMVTLANAFVPVQANCEGLGVSFYVRANSIGPVGDQNVSIGWARCSWSSFIPGYKPA